MTTRPVYFCRRRHREQDLQQDHCHPPQSWAGPSTRPLFTSTIVSRTLIRTPLTFLNRGQDQQDLPPSWAGPSSRTVHQPQVWAGTPSSLSTPAEAIQTSLQARDDIILCPQPPRLGPTPDWRPSSPELADIIFVCQAKSPSVKDKLLEKAGSPRLTNSPCTVLVQILSTHLNWVWEVHSISVSLKKTQKFFYLVCFFWKHEPISEIRQARLKINVFLCAHHHIKVGARLGIWLSQNFHKIVTSTNQFVFQFFSFHLKLDFFTCVLFTFTFLSSWMLSSQLLCFIR